MKRLLCALLLCLCGTQLWAAGFSATVDRARLNEGETFDLILESDDATQFGMPDLAPLDPLFERISTRQENNMSNQGSSTRWIVTLLPKETGFVVVPPLTLGDARSQTETTTGKKLVDDAGTNYLLIGSDARPGETASRPTASGTSAAPSVT